MNLPASRSSIKSLLYRVKRILVGFQILILVWRRSAKLKHSLTCEKKGLFIDCGGNLGQGLAFFSRFYSPDKFNYIVVEPNPYCHETLRKNISKRIHESQFQIIEKAASTQNGTCLLYGLSPAEGGALSQGASIESQHNVRYYNPDSKSALEVCTFSLSELIHSCKLLYDIIVIKIDVEGAEYAIMNHLLEMNTAQLVSQFYIEFHSEDVANNLRPELKDSEVTIIKRLSALGVGFMKWI